MVERVCLETNQFGHKPCAYIVQIDFAENNPDCQAIFAQGFIPKNQGATVIKVCP